MKKILCAKSSGKNDIFELLIFCVNQGQTFSHWIYPDNLMSNVLRPEDPLIEATYLIKKQLTYLFLECSRIHGLDLYSLDDPRIKSSLYKGNKI